MIDRIVPAAFCEALYMLKYLQTVKYALKTAPINCSYLVKEKKCGNLNFYL